MLGKCHDLDACLRRSPAKPALIITMLDLVSLICQASLFTAARGLWNVLSNHFDLDIRTRVTGY
jgi:hypothetical protein